MYCSLPWPGLQPPPMPSTPLPSRAAGRSSLYLAHDERQVGEIVAAIGLDQPSVSKHLGVLRSVNLVRVRRNGRHRLYRTNAAAIRPLHEFAETFERYWQHQLTRVKERAEAQMNPQAPIAASRAPIQIDKFPKENSMTTMTVPDIESLTLKIEQEIRVRARLTSPSPRFSKNSALPASRPDGTPMNMKIEPVARRPLVPRPGRQQRPLLGHRAGHQAPHVA